MYVPRRDISVFKLIRTDTTLDLSQKAWEDKARVCEPGYLYLEDVQNVKKIYGILQFPSKMSKTLIERRRNPRSFVLSKVL